MSWRDIGKQDIKKVEVTQDAENDTRQQGAKPRKTREIKRLTANRSSTTREQRDRGTSVKTERNTITTKRNAQKAKQRYKREV